ncbi:hypothetical protein PHYPSEUDO_001783 [Phytophthora pseudosyringae]|uniref:Uncharacterized protein n=1 Tax=Phytophthora pseudosyringae TaxID=221518 RepID=A0A8T1VV08_9STRA|nr:hypothetical protein PHYPSEUDO_001783 [Phytophthora pseudosyringae]
MGLTPTKMMEHCTDLPKEGQEGFVRNVVNRGIDLQEHKQQARTREELIQRFEEMRATFVWPGGIFADEIVTETFGAGALRTSFTIDDGKPKSDMRALRTLKPMIVKELELGTTHRGRYLCGWVAVDDAFFGISATSLLLEDVTGDLVEIAVYGLVNSKLPSNLKQRAVASRFPKGQPIIVYEPYYKVRLDGSLGIRVEQATETIPWQDVPASLVAWKKLGNEFFSVQAGQSELCTLVMLLNNIATCRFKKGEYAIAIQLSGAAVHLDPSYFKGWLRLASSLARIGSDEVAARVVAHACNILPSASPKELQLLNDIIKTKYPSSTPEYSKLRSFPKWWMTLALPGFVLSQEVRSGEIKTADFWRKEGSNCFTKGELDAAEECYRNGLAASASCRHDASIVMNNGAAVHLMNLRDTKAVSGISVGEEGTSSAVSALINSTVAGVIDPLNYKAWSRRARCLESLGVRPAECIDDLDAIRSSVLSSRSDTKEQMLGFKRGIAAEIQRRSLQQGAPTPVHGISDVPTHVQREQRDALRPENIATAFGRVQPREETPFADVMNEEEQNIDEYIAQMEAFQNMTRFAFAASKSQPNHKQLPREIVMYLENSPPQMHVEFPKHRGWPVGIEPTVARKVLYRAFLDASCNPWVKAYSMRNGEFFEKMNPIDMVKRWHGTGALQIIQEKSDGLKFGDIVDAREAQGDLVPAYDARIRSNFANNPNRAEVYFFGTTHVAIGFNDFSSLLAATLRDELDNGLPSQFVGFEMSEFAVAKCKVVAQMLGSPEVAIASVMEVWLSSTWSEVTLKLFRKSVNVVLLTLDKQTENAKMVSYLRHWVSAEPISAGKAHSEFFLNLERYNKRVLSALFCFRREIDRLDLTHYMLTGEVRAPPNILTFVETDQARATVADASEPQISTSVSKTKRNRKKKRNANKEAPARSSAQPLVGSLTMWNVPPGAPPLEEDIVFNTVDFMKILENYAEREKTKKNSTDRLSVVDLFVIHVLENLNRLRGLMLANKLTVEVHYGVVKAIRGEAAEDPVNEELLARIAMIRPYTISWSNVLDYFLPEDFHDLARRCSMHGDCVHYGYSMNWPTEVFGASLIDYDFESCKTMIDGLLDSVLGFPKQSQASKLPSLMDMFKVVGLDKLLLFPLRDNPLNSTGYLLANGYKQKWIDHFMSKGALSAKASQRLGATCTPSNCGLQKGEMELAMPSPLYRTSVTLYMSWCYDPELRLQAVDHSNEVSTAADADLLALGRLEKCTALGK